jgi:hypothetical protein
VCVFNVEVLLDKNHPGHDQVKETDGISGEQFSFLRHQSGEKADRGGGGPEIGGKYDNEFESEYSLEKKFANNGGNDQRSDAIAKNTNGLKERTEKDNS